MEALGHPSTPDALVLRLAPKRRTAARAVAVLAAGTSLAGFGLTGVAGAVTIPDATPIFCVGGVPCGSVSDNPASTPTTPSKQDTEAAKKAAHEAEKDAKKAAHEAEKAAEKAAKKAAEAEKKASKEALPNRGDLKQFLGDSSVIDNGGHKWG